MNVRHYEDAPPCAVKVGELDLCEGGRLLLEWDGAEYVMRQFHYHAPSEHTVGGEAYDAEAHFVFVPVEGSGPGPVIGVFMNATNGDSRVLASSVLGPPSVMYLIYAADMIVISSYV